MSGVRGCGRCLAAALLLALVAGCSTAEIKDTFHKTTRTGVEIKDKAVVQGSALAADTAAHGKAVAKTTTKALRKGFADLTPQEEYFIGRAVAARILGLYRPVENPAATRYLNAIVLTVAQASSSPETFGGWHLTLLDSDEVNAFAAPGGFIFVTRGLYQSCRTEEQLATVIAHEVGHVTLRHGLAAIKTSRLTEAFAIIGTEAVKEFTGANLAKLTEAFAGTVDDIIDQMVSLGYSRRQEYAADAEAGRIAWRAGYNPAGLAEFLRTLQEKSAKAEKKGFFSSHPPAADRLKKVESLLADEKLKGPTDPARTARFAKIR
ncbi:MAG: M48 family metalloprotease [Candidatus Methylomirabilia bacterium]